MSVSSAAVLCARAARGELETLVLERPFSKRLSLVIDLWLVIEEGP